MNRMARVRKLVAAGMLAAAVSVGDARGWASAGPALRRVPGGVAGVRVLSLYADGVTCAYGAGGGALLGGPRHGRPQPPRLASRGCAGIRPWWLPLNYVRP